MTSEAALAGRTAAAGIPRDTSLDATLALRAEGYAFIANRCRRYHTDVFETRLMLQRVVCMRGAEAAEIFYTPGRFTRRGAMPPTTVALLTGEGGVQLLDGDAHRRRKAMFLGLMTPLAIRRLAHMLRERWQAELAGWRGREVVLLDEVQIPFCRAVCAWAGVPLAEDQVEPRTRELAAMVEGTGGIGPRTWRAMLLAKRTERWIQQLIAQVRAGDLEPPPGSGLRVIAEQRDVDGRLLAPKVAAIEVINLLRPTVAIARFVAFAALALHQHPAWRARLQAGDDDELTLFVQEVRRFYPFFPVVGGRVRQPFTWRGHDFADQAWVLLDLFGTDRDPARWEEPDAFRPERFRTWGGSAFDFIPQGGGDHASDHRCPGEWITIELMKTAVRLLTSGLTYEVPEQDLEVDLARIPARPASGFVITNVRPAA